MESLAQRGEAAGDDDDRNVADLLLDQIEFADVVVLNKCDLISPDEQHRLVNLLQALNPGAEIVTAVNSKIPLEKVINTGRFSFEKAAQSAGWLRSLQQGNNLTPETEEYGIGSLVYRARRPFHPGRLYDFISKHFILQEPDWRDAMEDGWDGKSGLLSVGVSGRMGSMPRDTDGAARQAAIASAEAAQRVVEALKELQGAGIAGQDGALLTAAATAAAAAAAASSAVAQLIAQLPLHDSVNRALSNAGASLHRNLAHEGESAVQPRARLTASFGQVFRSKGFIWIASRPDLCGEWSQAGGILRFTVGGPWYAALPSEAWPEDPDQLAQINSDFEGPHGDRRQELVFIGINIDRDALFAALDSCLLGADEDVGMDPFAPWPPLDQILDAGGDDEEEQEQEQEQAQDGITSIEDGHEGGVREVLDGAAEVQGVLNALGDGRLAVVQWHAPWCRPSHEASAELDALAKAHPEALLFRVDVDSSPANYAFAMEKVMELPTARREGAKPVLRLGAKFPAFTLHRAPMLQPYKQLGGDSAMQQVQEALMDEVLKNESTSGKTKVSNFNNNVRALTGGAGHLKEMLASARDQGKDALVLWISTKPGALPPLETRKQEELYKTVSCITNSSATIVLADVAASLANAVLADAMGAAKDLPCVHIVRSMKVVSKFMGNDVTPGVIQRACGSVVVEPTTTSVKARNLSNSNSLQNGPQTRQPSEFDPPVGKFARPGAVKHLPDGRTAHFFPKMPCLRCGCPWWTSDEWDARCVRCGWDCEKQGYDDDSKPLPAFVKKWEGFVAAIRKGETPAWAGTRSK